MKEDSAASPRSADASQSALIDRIAARMVDRSFGRGSWSFLALWKKNEFRDYARFALEEIDRAGECPGKADCG